MRELKVIYLDDGCVRCVRGVKVIQDDPIFLKLLRADGSIIQFNRALVQRIEEEEVSGRDR